MFSTNLARIYMRSYSYCYARPCIACRSSNAGIWTSVFSGNENRYCFQQVWIELSAVRTCSVALCIII